MGFLSRPSVCGAVISEPNARICFKFGSLLPLGDMLGRSVCRFGGKFFFDFFTNIFCFR